MSSMNTDELVRFKDMAALQVHTSSPASQALKKGASEEESLLAPPDTTVIQPIGGFAQRS